MVSTGNREPIATLAQVEQLDADHPGDMVKGYFDGFYDRAWPKIDPSQAYEHGRRNGVSDRTGKADPEQQQIAREFVARSRATTPPTRYTLNHGDGE